MNYRYIAAAATIAAIPIIITAQQPAAQRSPASAPSRLHAPCQPSRRPTMSRRGATSSTGNTTAFRSPAMIGDYGGAGASDVR